jgi:hypothetical protein
MSLLSVSVLVFVLRWKWRGGAVLRALMNKNLNRDGKRKRRKKG